MQQYACRLAKWRAGNVLDILQRGMYISNPGLQHSELAHRGGRLCLSLSHSLIQSINHFIHLLAWGPTGGQQTKSVSLACLTVYCGTITCVVYFVQHACVA